LYCHCSTNCLTTMAKQTTPIKDPEPLASLSRDTLEHMEAIKSELEAAKKGLDALDELGIDTSRLREKINWGFKAREVILKQFGEKG